MADGEAQRWTLIPRPQARARIRLVCLGHAGSGASTYFGWGALLQPAAIEVRAIQYPGRESRFNEPRIESVREMVRQLADNWAGISGGAPCALYGHSMGALIAFELVAELERRGRAAGLRRLFVSAYQAPHLTSRAPVVHLLPESEFLPTINACFGGLPDELMRDPEAAALISATLRSDFVLVENYRWAGTPPVSVPLRIMGGTDDPWVSREELEAWRRHTTADAALRFFPGAHFFNQQHRDAVLAYVADELAGAL